MEAQEMPDVSLQTAYLQLPTWINVVSKDRELMKVIYWHFVSTEAVYRHCCCIMDSVTIHPAYSYTMLLVLTSP